MAVKRFSHAAARALRLLGENTRPAAREAYELMREELAGAKGNGIARNWSVYSRVLSEMWRNGWVNPAGDAPDKAVAAAAVALSLDAKDYYTHWLLAYAYKTRARSAGDYKSDWTRDIALAQKHYGHAHDRLVAERKQDASAAVAGEFNAVVFDWAETYVYTGEPARAVEEMEAIIQAPDRAKPQDWQDWAYAFALHQCGRYLESIGICEGLLQAKNANNDIRLLLAASEARSHLTMQATDTAAQFHQQRRPASGLAVEDREPTWTVALEIERGAFPPGMPSEGEAHWAESMRRARLDESAGEAKPRPPLSFLKPDEPALKRDFRGGAEAAPPRGRKRRPTKKKATKRKARKKPARKKAVKGTARRKPLRRRSRGKAVRRSAKRKR